MYNTIYSNMHIFSTDKAPPSGRITKVKSFIHSQDSHQPPHSGTDAPIWHTENQKIQTGKMFGLGIPNKSLIVNVLYCVQIILIGSIYRTLLFS